MLQGNSELICNISCSLLVSLCGVVCHKFVVRQYVTPPGEDLPALRQLLAIAAVLPEAIWRIL
jgi:hypothetical protein